MRLFLFWVLAGVSLLTSCQTDTESLPNVVFVLADDLGWADLPIYGNRFNEAPNLELLARQGVVFDIEYFMYLEK